MPSFLYIVVTKEGIRCWCFKEVAVNRVATRKLAESMRSYFGLLWRTVLRLKRKNVGNGVRFDLVLYKSMNKGTLFGVESIMSDIYKGSSFR